MAALTDEAQSNLVETATAATRQIRVAEIAALTTGVPTQVTVEGCEPGFYYTLHGADGKVSFPEVEKPSDAAGFFSIGVSETKVSSERSGEV